MMFPNKEKKLFNKIVKQLNKNAQKNLKANNSIKSIDERKKMKK